jgi:hypothetical protein
MKKEKRLLLLLVPVLVGALLLSSVSAGADEDPSLGRSLAEVRRALEQELSPLAGAGFVGIAHSEADGEVIVFVEDERAEKEVPHSFQGCRVRTEVTGRIESLSSEVVEPVSDVSEKRREGVRPLVGGTSLSAYVTEGPWIYLYAGTLGMITYDDKILSNAHVLAMNPDTNEFLDVGTPVIQPGSGDGGRLDDRVGELEEYIPIVFGSGEENYADAAIGSIGDGVEVSYGEEFDEAGNYWIEGWTEVSEGDIVRKSGRTTGVTDGKVLYTNAEVWVDYDGRRAYFVDQIVVDQDNWSFSAPGDSGSAVDKDGEFVGLVFAGSEGYAYINKAEHIIDGLGVAFEPMENQYSLTISSTEGGSVTTPGEGRFIYDAETAVALFAQPEEHYHFVGWTGDVNTIADVGAPETTISVNASYSITANFELDEGWYGLTTSSTQGGSVTEPGEGTFIYEDATGVELVATDDEHYHFVEWTGDVDTVTDVHDALTNIAMNASYSIGADFELDYGWYSLSISSTEGGSVTQPGEGISVHAGNTTVELVAQADEGYQFAKWTGNVSTVNDIRSAETTIAMNASYSITATFETSHPEPVALLTVYSTPGGSVTVPGEEESFYPIGTEVSLVAVADEGHEFIDWSGDVDTIADVDSASTVITMDGSYTIRANFTNGGWCFIATAAYGTSKSEEIQILRQFRDEYLLTSAMGKAFVDLYYMISPPIAELVIEHPGLKPIVRAGLLPVITMATMVINTVPSGL